MAYSQVPRMALLANWVKSGRLASPIWLQATAIAPTFFVRNQERNRHYQGDLGQEHELREAERLGRQKRKRLLHRQQKRGDDSANASQLAIDSAFLRRRRLHLGEPGLRRCNIEGVDASGPLPVHLENDKPERPV
jgi:hypothetical protein